MYYDFVKNFQKRHGRAHNQAAPVFSSAKSIFTSRISLALYRLYLHPNVKVTSVGKTLIVSSFMNLQLNWNDLWIILNESSQISWLWRQRVSSLFHRHLDAPFGCDVAHTKFPNTVPVASTDLDWSVKWKTNFLICKMDFPDILYCTFFLEKQIQVFVQENEKR